MIKVTNYCDLCKKEVLVGYGTFSLQIGGIYKRSPVGVCPECYKALEDAVLAAYMDRLIQLNLKTIEEK